MEMRVQEIKMMKNEISGMSADRMAISSDYMLLQDQMEDMKLKMKVLMDENMSMKMSISDCEDMKHRMQDLIHENQNLKKGLEEMMMNENEIIEKRMVVLIISIYRLN